MGISSALAAGVMGLNVNSSKLATISDNIANSETKGYKRADVDFNSLVLNERPTAYDAGGVRASTMRHIEDQGALLSTRNATDLAISGRGFLPVTDIAEVRRGEQNLPLKLTRTGSFRPDQDGVLQTSLGLVLMGWPSVNGGFGTQRSELQPIKLDSLKLAAEPTTRMDVQLNLDAGAGETQRAAWPLEYFDALGRTQQLDLRFEKLAAANTWSMQVVEPAAAPGATLRGEYQVTFHDADGVEPGGLATVAPTAGDPGFTAWNTAVLDESLGDMTVTLANGETLTLGLGALDGAEGKSGLAQFASESQLLSASRDGAPASTLVDVEIDENGIMDAIYDTGFRQSLFKIPVANVQNPNGMNAIDGASFGLTRESGDVYFYDAGSGPTGALVSNALEESTTDVAEELTQLIKTQRAYSSNAKIIQTVDEMLQETTNLKR